MDTADQIIKVLDNLGQKFGMAFDGAKENLVPFVKELGGKIVSYQIATDWFWIIIGIILLIIGIVGFVVEAKCKLSYEWKGCGVLVGFIGCIAGVIFISYNVYDLILCYTLPEKVVLDYVKDFIQHYK